MCEVISNPIGLIDTIELGFIILGSLSAAGLIPSTTQISVKISGFTPTFQGAELHNPPARALAVEDLGAAAADTLCSHEVGEVPDELARDVLLPLLVEAVVVAPEHFFLVLLREHHGRILGRKKHLKSPATA